MAVPGLAVFLAIILYFGDTASLVLFSLLSGMAAFEAVGLCVAGSPIAARAAFSVAAALSAWLLGVGTPLALPGMLLPALVLAPWWVFRRRPEGTRPELLGALGLTGYYSLGFGLLSRLSVGHEDRMFVLLPLVVCWVGDSCAYFVGCRWGRHKILPRVSPAKSWEGFVAGLLGSMAVAAALGWGRHPLPALLAIGLACGVAGVLGDLFESAVKRDVGIKDSGSLLADHGGILDRFDSVAAAVPTAFALMIIFGMN